MERPISSTHPNVSAAPCEAGNLGKLEQPAAAPTFLPIRISDSGELVLDPGQTQNAYLTQLQKLRQSKEALQKAGYVLQPLTEVELDQKKKCGRCHKYVFKKVFKRTFDGKPKPGSDKVAGAAADQRPSGEGATNAVPKATKGGERTKKASNGSQQECKYHSGRFNGRTWSCCKAGAYNPPCKTSPEHEAAEYKPGELERQYRYHRTPAASPSSTPRLAVAFDCEMGTSTTNESLCIRVSVIDYFTAEVLVDKLVFPDEPLLNYNTRFSGVSYSQMARAKAMGDCFFGIAAAREAIWKFVGPDTIVVGHSGQNDLNSLRWLHDNIVDTQLVESLPVVKLEKAAREKAAIEKEAIEKEARKKEALREGEEEPNGQATKKFGSKDLTKGGPQSKENQKPTEQPKKKPKGSGRFSLKSLTKARAGREIQMGREGHDSVKDAVATRDIAHWNVVNFGHGFYEIDISPS